MELIEHQKDSKTGCCIFFLHLSKTENYTTFTATPREVAPQMKLTSTLFQNCLVATYHTCSSVGDMNFKSILRHQIFLTCVFLSKLHLWFIINLLALILTAVSFLNVLVHDVKLHPGVGGALRPETAAHLGEGKPRFQTSAALRDTCSKAMGVNLKEKSGCGVPKADRCCSQRRSSNLCDTVGAKRIHHQCTTCTTECFGRRSRCLKTLCVDFKAEEPFFSRQQLYRCFAYFTKETQNNNLHMYTSKNNSYLLSIFHNNHHINNIFLRLPRFWRTVF